VLPKERSIAKVGKKGRIERGCQEKVALVGKEVLQPNNSGCNLRLKA